MSPASGLPRRVHCTGVAGGGVSVLAGLLASLEHEVSGSDRAGVPATLVAAGVRAAHDDGPALAAQADLLVRSAAVPDDDAEVSAARDAGVPVIKYAEALGRLMAGRRGVAVAGTHGKTTTAALTAHLLQHAGRAPAWIVGGRPLGLPSSAWGRGEILVAEACEYDLSFLQLGYEVAVITGVAADHLDCFGDLEGVRAAFRRFAARVPPGGTLVLGPGLAPEGLIDDAPPERVVAVDHSLRLESLQPDDQGWRGELLVDGERRLPLRCPLWGTHNLHNALCALAAARAVGVEVEVGLAGLASFAGVGRRLQDRGEQPLADGGRVRLVDDFAHHPDALAAAAEALTRHLPGRRRVALFQPHQVSRTEEHLDQFIEVLGRFDVVGLCDIFVARDARPERAADLVEILAERAGPHVRRLGPAASADAAARALLRPDDVCVVMGAGDVDGLARRLGGEPAGP